MRASPVSRPCLRLCSTREAGINAKSHAILSAGRDHSSAEGLGTFLQTLNLRSRSARLRRLAVSIAVGDKIPDVKLTYFDVNGNMHEVQTAEFCAGKKVVIFGVPGAFLPTCSMKHVPGYLNLADDMKARGVDTIACVSVNDAFVMDAWGKMLGADKIFMLADGNADFAKAMRLSLDLTERGVGIRSRRYSLLADDGMVLCLHLEEGGAYTVSSADQIMADLDRLSL